MVTQVEQSHAERVLSDLLTGLELIPEAKARTVTGEYHFSRSTDGTVSLSRLGEEPGTPGGIRYDVAGRPMWKDKNSAFAPTVARGMRHDHGKYWQWFLSSDVYRGAIADIEQAIRSGRFVFEYDPDEVPEGFEELADERLAALRGAWTNDWCHAHAREANFKLISGFSLFEKTWDPIARRLDLHFIWPHQVDKWITDARQRQWVGATLHDVAEPVESWRLVHYAHDAYGLDLEGNSPLRSVGLLIQLQQDLMRLYAISATAYGVPWTWITSEDANADAGDDAALVTLASSGRADGRPVFKLKSGYKVEITSPDGAMPDFLEMLRYLGERVTQMLRADGVLLGHQTVGSYALSESKDSKALRQARYFGDIIASRLTELVPEFLGYLFELPELAPGVWPRCRFDLGIDDDRWEPADLVALASAGLLERTPEVIRAIHERMGLPMGLGEDVEGNEGGEDE